MNVAAAYEIALAAVIRAYGEVGEDTVIRTWQRLSNDTQWNGGGGQGDRSFPCIDIRCAPPVHDADGTANMIVTAQIEIRTLTADDKDHLEISRIYESVQAVFDALFDQFFNDESGDELAAFQASIDAEYGSAFPFGAFAFADSVAPWDDDGANAIAFNFALHYSRSAVTQG